VDSPGSPVLYNLFVVRELHSVVIVRSCLDKNDRQHLPGTVYGSGGMANVDHTDGDSFESNVPHPAIP
jgi:hypothetical protein